MNLENKKNLPLIVLLGRTNVGKSTLFNCLLEKRQALISGTPGTTRDYNEGTLEWQGVSLNVVDTGGIMDFNDKAIFTKNKKILKTNKAKNVEKERISGETKSGNLGQTEINDKVQQKAIEFLQKADLVLFLVDNKTGLLPQDKALANLLKKNKAIKEKILLVANKVDSIRHAPDAAEFNKLGLGEPILISSTTGSGTGDMLDIIIKALKKKKKIKKQKNIETDPKENISVCLLGKPNVGKSSLLNKLLGEEKVIVSSIPHTTREPQNIEMTYKGKLITFIDTAGISKHGKKEKGLEKHSIEKSLLTLSRSNVALLIIDINKNITHQDAKLVEEIMERGKSLIIIANKWDLVPEKDTKKYKQYIYSKLPFATWAPIQFVSALTGEKITKIFDLIIELDNARKISIPASSLSRFLAKLVKIHTPSKGRGFKKPRVYGLEQIRTNPPKFILKIGAVEDLHNSYTRFVKNKLRERYKITGAPLDVIIVKNKKIHGQHEHSKSIKLR